MRYWLPLVILLGICGAILILLIDRKPVYTGDYWFEKPIEWEWVLQDRIAHPVARAPRTGDFFPSLNVMVQEHEMDLDSYIDHSVRLCEISFREFEVTNRLPIVLDSGATGQVYTAVNRRFPEPILQDHVYILTNDLVSVLTYTRLLEVTNTQHDTAAYRAIHSFAPPSMLPDNK